MLLWLAKSEITAAFTSLALAPPKVSGPVPGFGVAKFAGLHLLVCQMFVNGAEYSRVGLVGLARPTSGVNGLKADRPASALLPVVVKVGSGAPPTTSQGWGVAPAVWRSSNVQGAAGEAPAGKQPT